MPFDVFARRVLYVVAAAIAAVTTTPIDLWWLLRAGQDTWRSHHVNLVEQWSHTAHGRYWPNHEWLWEVLAYLLHRLGGMPLLNLFVALTVLAMLAVLRRVSGAQGYVVPLVLGLSIPLLGVAWVARPQVTSLLLLAVTLLLLTRERFWWLPPLFLLWANLHGQVVLGGAVLGACLVGAAITRHPRVLRLLAATVLSALATLITPLGPRLWTYVLGANGRPGQDRIAEWSSALHLDIASALVWGVLLVVGTAVALRRRRLDSWAARVPLFATIALAPLAVMAIRNLPFLTLAAVPLLMTLLSFDATPGRVRRASPALAFVSLVSAAFVVLLWVRIPAQLGWRPVSPALASALRACPGPLYNNYDDGAAIVWFVPDVPVFVDNRQDPYPARVLEAGISLTAHQRVLSEYDVQCALLPARSAVAAKLRETGWSESYRDESSVVLSRATSASE